MNTLFFEHGSTELPLAALQHRQTIETMFRYRTIETDMRHHTIAMIGSIVA